MENTKKIDLDVVAKDLANTVYQSYQAHNCRNLLIKWTDEYFWGKVAKDHLRTFIELWDILNNNNITQKNPIRFCDADFSVWVGNTIEKNRKVIVAHSSTVCRDDNTYIFILENGSKFRIVTVWGKEKKNKHGGWIEKPSLKTYIARDYKYGYGDMRDPGHILAYDFWDERADYASITACEISKSLEHLEWLLYSAKEELNLNKKG
jgi:hypothetical protein